MLCLASLARANTNELLGVGPRGTAMSGALTADAQDHTAVFYNPSLLVLRKDAIIGLGFSWMRTTSEVEPLTPSRELDCSRCEPPDSVGYQVGALFPLGGKVKNRVALGIGAFLPSGSILHLRAVDPDRPFWYQYNTDPERLEVHTAAGVRITDWLSVGAGVHLVSDVVGNGAHVKVDLFSKEVKVRELDSMLASRFTPMAGLLVRPRPFLRFGASFRSEVMFQYRIPAELDVDGVGTLAFSLSGKGHYSPHTFNAGVAWDVLPELTVSAEGNYALWSAAPSPYLEVNVDLEGTTLNGLGLEDLLDLSVPAKKPGFADTLGGKVGLEYRLSDRFAGRAGASIRPTPVPKQNVAHTNILDATAIGVSAGVGVAFEDPLEVFQAPIHVDVGGALTWLEERKAVKDPMDAVPSYRYSASVFGLNVGVRYEF